MGGLLLALKYTTDMLSSTYRDTCGELLHSHHLPTSKYTMVYLSSTRTALVNIFWATAAVLLYSMYAKARLFSKCATVLN